MPGASKPIATFTRQHPQTGDTQTRDAYSPDEVVNLTADGWVKKTSKTSTTSSSTGSSSTGSSKPTNS